MNDYWKNRKLHLISKGGEFTADVDIAYLCGDEEKVMITMELDNKIYRGCGNDFLGVEAFADLQKQLPEDVVIRCCVSCRHGNLCPVGDEPGELFCTRDVEITQKSDLYFYTEDADQREKRLRTYMDVCGNHQVCSEEYFTYNDYSYYLKKGIK